MNKIQPYLTSYAANNPKSIRKGKRHSVRVTSCFLHVTSKYEASFSFYPFLKRSSIIFFSIPDF